jgi:hypothetical protein
MATSRGGKEADVDTVDPVEKVSAERVALNDAAFRKANEAIRATTDDWEMDGLLPAICECAEPRCTELLQLTAAEYEEVRADPRWFINAPGHHVNAQGWARVVEDRDRYVIAEKIGEAGEIVEQLDPRNEDS